MLSAIRHVNLTLFSSEIESVNSQVWSVMRILQNESKSSIACEEINNGVGWIMMKRKENARRTILGMSLIGAVRPINDVGLSNGNGFFQRFSIHEYNLSYRTTYF